MIWLLILNPIRRIDPTGMLYDDYFNRQGQYLGTDNSKTDYIRIVDQEEWNQYKKSDGNIDPIVGKEIGALHSQSGISADATLSIYEHYNPTNVKLELNNNISNMSYSIEYTKKNGEFKLLSEKMLLNAETAISYNYADKISDIQNSFIHESKHYMDRINWGLGKYINTSHTLRELRAIEVQYNDPSWMKTSEAFKNNVKAYANKLNIGIIGLNWGQTLKLNIK